MESVNEIVFDGGNDSEDILEQLLTSNHYYGNGLDVSKFLDKDNTIDLEKLELAIILLIDYLENSVNFESPIYINLGNMSEYVSRRKLTDIDRIIEESSFILGFSQSIADEYKIDRDVVVRFRGKDA